MKVFKNKTKYPVRNENYTVNVISFPAFSFHHSNMVPENIDISNKTQK